MDTEKIPPEDAVVVVLGARVLENRLSGTLYNRVKTAADHLLQHPHAKCITTGGQGANEVRTEGEAARAELLGMGIAPERVFAEIRSATTWENLCFAKEVIQREKLSSHVVISTQRFHQWRAGKMAEQLGLVPYRLVAADRPRTQIRHTVREGFAILKFLLFSKNRKG